MARVTRGERIYDIARMSEEVETARAILEFADGPYGNAISLPSADQIHTRYRTHHNNVPFSAALDACPYMKSIFDSFETETASFRLLRRVAHSAYAFHDDKDRGRDIARFQIPINTSKDAFLLIATNGLDLERLDATEDASGDIWFDMQQLRDTCSDAVELYYLEAGCVNYFDTDQVHTLVNGSEEERVTLSFDLVMNEWLENWMRANLTHAVSPSPIEPSSSIRWNWTALRHGIIRTD